MEIRHHKTGNTTSEAHFSPCGRYRYLLSRHWQTTGHSVNFIMLNPSVADEFANDPTVERCERRARAMGFAGFSVTNIFAWRDTDPKAMRRAKKPIGPLNELTVLQTAQNAGQAIAAWGVHGAHTNQGPHIARILDEAGVKLFHLGLTKDGHPRHPLYVPYSIKPKIWHVS